MFEGVVDVADRIQDTLRSFHTGADGAESRSRSELQNFEIFGIQSFFLQRLYFSMAYPLAYPIRAAQLTRKQWNHFL